MNEFSLLMSVYKHEKAEFFSACFDSIYEQSILPTEIILVEDGPIPLELQVAIEREEKRFPCLKRIVLEKNSGLGVALDKGLQVCSFDIVARMDTDDICMPNRFQKQLEYLHSHSDIDVLGAWITEFDYSPDNTVAIRNLPENHEDIYEFGKSRNPINHPVVMFRKHAVIEAGGYQPFPLFEDYYLWARMLKAGYRFHNMPESLLLFRRSPEMVRRRGGLTYANNEIYFQMRLYKLGYISIFRLIKNVCQRYGVRLAPNWARSLIYKHLLRIRINPNS
jgi:glycosyltransferase involved in cell wall biosynthesis